MKPISLKIKGLNSFIEEQIIDFKRLTDKGLFGIFGPTGSGKSTILDGITLALYGEVSRKSSNFINTNCNSVNVVYHFQISGAKIKKYTVEREFKRDKSGNIRSKSAKILDVTCEAVEVLEEGAKNVTAKCKEIIGLELDDFTRTVVLPQGKFSDFLKLEGKDRRNMLERLFNLQKYGDNLSNKLIGEIKGERQKYNILQGELKGYEDIDNESLKLKEERLELALKNKENIEKELIVIEKEYNENSVIWNLQEELRKSEHIFKELKLKEKENNIKEIKILKGESYLKIKPYMDARDETLKQYNIENKKLNIIQKDTENIKVEKEKLEVLLKKAIDKKENELPSLKIKKNELMKLWKKQKILKS
ncbi:AAA family ATPase [Clostridium senegalense]|uniref:AAA family ATPase n=1 Tax=Clostridium senegalense TaxID=1465809 RepID=UPI00030D5F7A|nr:AAA family ATPase [Clostridium senegalense]